MKPESHHTLGGVKTTAPDEQIKVSEDQLASTDAGSVADEHATAPKVQPTPEKRRELTESLTRTRKNAKIFAMSAICVVLVAASVGVGTYFIRTRAAATEAQSASPAQTVTVAKAAVLPVDDVLSVTGSVSAWDPLNIGAEISGLRIVSVNVEEGDAVKKGQPLAVLNSALLRAQLEQAQAKLASSHASLKKAIKPNRDEEILALKATLAQSEADIAQQEALKKEAQYKLSDAELNAERYKQLSKVGAVSHLEYETKQLAADTARDELISADAKIKAAKSLFDQNRQKLLQAQRGGRTEDVDISQASIAEMKAQIEQLNEQINQTILRAPDDGVVSKRSAHLGEIASAGTPLFSIIRANRIELKAQVTDLDIPRITPGQKVAISTKEEDSAQKIQGKVRLISPQIDDASRIGIVRIDLPANCGLRPGMFVHGEIELGHRKALTVPPQAVVRRNGESFVFILDGDHAQSCEVKTGLETDKFIEITEGLKEGQAVIYKGARFLSDRDLVRVSQ